METKLNLIRKKLRSNEEQTQQLVDLGDLKALIEKNQLCLVQNRDKCLEQQAEVR